MNWLNSCALTWHWHGCGFEPWWTKIIFFFC